MWCFCWSRSVASACRSTCKSPSKLISALSDSFDASSTCRSDCKVWPMHLPSSSVHFIEDELHHKTNDRIERQTQAQVDGFQILERELISVSEAHDTGGCSMGPIIKMEVLGDLSLPRPARPTQIVPVEPSGPSIVMSLLPLAWLFWPEHSVISVDKGFPLRLAWNRRPLLPLRSARELAIVVRDNPTRK